MSSYTAEASVLVGEVLGSLYPQLLRIVKSPIEVQTLLRVLTFTGLAWAMMKDRTVKPDWFQGAVNTLHILTSYYAFRTIASGDALALFYTYPLWNILFARIALKEEIDVLNGLMTVVGVIGAVTVSMSMDHVDLSPKLSSSANGWMYGVIAALLAAVTESIMYINYHDASSSNTPNDRVYSLYAGSIPYVAIVALAGPWLFKRSPSENNGGGLRSAGLIVLFNVFVGFVGHLLRAYGALGLRADVFASLSLSGIIFGYVIMYVVERKKPKVITILGALAILVAGLVTTYRSTDGKRGDDVVPAAVGDADVPSAPAGRA